MKETRAIPGLNLAGHVGDEPHRVAMAREAVARALGLAPGQVAWMKQVHSTTVALARPLGHREQAPTVDALLLDTRDPACHGIRALGVLTADCVPLLLASDDGAILAAVHAGRRGMAHGIVAAVLTQIAARGVEPGQLSAVIGPCICSACYEVGLECQGQTAALEPASACTTRWGSAGLDVAAGVEAGLRRGGVERISRPGWCTLEDERFYSYRRDPGAGRLAGIIVAQ